MRITTTAELLKAVELGIVDKTEARSILGLSVKRGRWAKIQPRSGGRFSRAYPFNRFSDDAKRAMILAQDLAKSGDRAYIEPDDLLVAIVQQDSGVGAAILHTLGITERSVRFAVDNALRDDVPADTIGPTSAMKRVIETAFHSVEYPSQIDGGHLLLAMAATEGAARTALIQLGATPEAISRQVSVREDLRT